MTPIASVIIPAYQMAHCLADAIESALAQTVPVDVVIVDDGSTDGTGAILERYAGRVVTLRLPHGGPCKARNAGLEAATGEFVMLLDADDTIAPNKIEAQLAEFTDEIGWVICDVRIEDAATGKAVNASERYEYGKKELGGWIQPLLTAGNFIPIMSPLVRRSVLSGIRFDDARVPEDWHFWHAVAGVARVRYCPQVLATYRKSRTGRSRIPKAARLVSPNIKHPLRLNLGCGTRNTRSWHPIEGFVNLDKSMGWRFEDGLGEFIDGSVAGISISHAAMYLPLSEWPAFMAECARVLAPGGVLRITEDNTADTRSRTYPDGWRGSEPAVTLTHPAMVRAHMEAAGLKVYDVSADETRYVDRSLMQDQHGGAPHCFYVEGVKECAVLFEPHSDDSALFASFTILRHRPRIVTCYGSTGEYGDTATRARETVDAMAVLGGGPCVQWNGGDLQRQMRELDAAVRPSRVFAPSMDCSHPDHKEVAHAALVVFGERLTQYQTYNAQGKVREGVEVAYEPAWVLAKLRALARYESQATHPRAHTFFLNDLREWLEPDE